MSNEMQSRINRQFYRDRDGYDAVDKTVVEQRVLGFDYTNELDSGETIDASSVAWTITPNSPAIGNATSATITNSLTAHTVMVTSGEVGQRYLFESTVMTSQGRRLNRAFRLYVLQP